MNFCKLVKDFFEYGDCYDSLLFSEKRSEERKKYGGRRGRRNSTEIYSGQVPTKIKLKQQRNCQVIYKQARFC